jgi:hypothetical protein
MQKARINSRRHPANQREGNTGRENLLDFVKIRFGDPFKRR